MGSSVDFCAVPGIKYTGDQQGDDRKGDRLPVDLYDSNHHRDVRNLVFRPWRDANARNFMRSPVADRNRRPNYQELGVYRSTSIFWHASSLPGVPIVL